MSTTYDLEGLRAVVAEDYTPPERLTVSAFKKLSTNKREQWLAAREAHHGRSHVVLTDALGQAFTDISILSLLNRYRPNDREVYIISGSAGLGKTTIARKIGVNFEHDYGVRFPDYQRNDECPVVMITTPAKCNPTALDKALLGFMHYSYPEGRTHERLKSVVVKALRDKRVQLVIIDDLHRLRSGTQISSLETADLLKEYFDLSTCTFVFLGIDLTATGFFEGNAGQQILNRGALLTIDRCSNVAGAKHNEWRGIVAGLEDNLRLLNHRRGTLTTDAMLESLYTLTHGSLGAVNKLLQTAAMYASTVADPATEDLRDLGIVGKESIDKAMLKKIKTVAAEQFFTVAVEASET
ncbi:TniB family NTP-binding protein [Gordonia amicalis]|uniref:TniB family NTP-binding protein n=1 Tax=Gordonia amicalis TaxID=89053 RepID=UPI0015F60E1E|nr:TniB family NTP-binding protein [Gordonia amicalis]MBA5846873.1 TniB family NTP-binding protein [Gordonia amicalis]